ncbi:hypothetical protein HDU82_003613 [Entophlyctis luteolus]|nr:hypothetical protein HDU82_003613 [Entophlyctis luteolus]
MSTASAAHDYDIATAHHSGPKARSAADHSADLGVPMSRSISLAQALDSLTSPHKHASSTPQPEPPFPASLRHDAPDSRFASADDGFAFETLHTEMNFGVDLEEYKDKLKRISELELAVLNLETEKHAMSLQNKNLKTTVESMERDIEEQVGVIMDLQADKENETTRQISQWTEHVRSAEEWTELEQKVDALIKENDVIVEENKAHEAALEQISKIVEKQSEEISSLKDSEAALRSALKDATSAAASNQEELAAHVEANKSLHASLTNANSANLELESAVREARAAAAKEKSRSEDIRLALDNLADQHRALVADAQRDAQREREAIEAVRALEAEKEELVAAIHDTNRRAEAIAAQNATLQDLVQSLDNRVRAAQAAEEAAVARVAALVAETETAVLDRDRVALRETAALDEIRRLTDKQAEFAARCKSKAESDVASLRAQHLSERKRLSEEISKLELGISQANARCERAMREKRSVESEHQKLLAHVPDEVERLNGIVEELASRLRVSERDRCDAMETLGSVQQRLTREQIKHDKEKEELVFQVDDFYRRLRRAEKDLEEAKEVAVKSMTQTAQLEHEIEKLNAEKTKARLFHESNIQSLQQKYETEIGDLNSKLTSLTLTHKKTCSDLSNILSVQHDLAAKWKSESSAVAARYDSIITDTRAHATRLAAQAKARDDDAKHASEAHAKTLALLDTERENYARAAARLADADAQINRACAALDEARASARKADLEKKALQRQIDRLHMEQERLERERSLKENRRSGRFILRDLNEATETDSQRDAQALQAEIDRVKHRTQASQFSNIEVYLHSLDDDDELET